MIGVFTDDGDRLSITLNGFELNENSQNPDDQILVDTTSSGQTFDYISETNQQRDGLEVYDARKVARMIKIQGRLSAPSLGRLNDRQSELGAATDPAKLSREHPDTYGHVELDFYTPTMDLATWPTGLIPCRMYARPVRPVEPIGGALVGYSVNWDLDLMLADPRRYLQTSVEQIGAGTVANPGTYYSWPKIAIEMFGAGSSTYSITNNPAMSGLPTTTLTLNLSGLQDDDNVLVDCERRWITVNGSPAMNRYVSGAYPEIAPGNNAISISNTTNTATAVTFRPAFSV